MFCSQRFHLTHLGKWVQVLLQQVKGRCKGRKRKLSSSSFDRLLSSSFRMMETSTQLEQVFNVIDANGDGKISSLELKDVLICLGHDKLKAAEEAEEIVKEVDCNGDGFIDMEEFMGVVGGRCGEGRREEELMDAFLIFDTDRNGFISAEELRRVLVSLGDCKCTLKECSMMIRGVDKNGDGLIDFEEFRSMMA